MLKGDQNNVHVNLLADFFRRLRILADLSDLSDLSVADFFRLVFSRLKTYAG